MFGGTGGVILGARGDKTATGELLATIRYIDSPIRLTGKEPATRIPLDVALRSPDANSPLAWIARYDPPGVVESIAGVEVSVSDLGRFLRWYWNEYVEPFNPSLRELSFVPTDAPRWLAEIDTVREGLASRYIVSVASLYAATRDLGGPSLRVRAVRPGDLSYGTKKPSKDWREVELHEEWRTAWTVRVPNRFVEIFAIAWTGQPDHLEYRWVADSTDTAGPAPTPGSYALPTWNFGIGSGRKWNVHPLLHARGMTHGTVHRLEIRGAGVRSTVVRPLGIVFVPQGIED